MGRRGEDPTGFYVELRKQSSIEACAALFSAAIAPFGFVAAACGEIDLADRDRNVLYFADWPPEWRRYYLDSGFVHRDPLLNALNLYRKPFTFRDIVRDPRFSNMDQEMLRAAAQHGWGHGLAVPVARGGTRFGLVTMLGDGPDLGEEEQARLCLMSECLLTKVRALVQTGASTLVPAGVTVREIEALRLVAVGCSDAQIGARLGISESTAHKHVESARKRLKAKSRAELAAVAISLALAPAAPTSEATGGKPR